jgi:hydrogenase/urease accessory protein HupE
MRCAPGISYGDRLTFKGLNLTDMEILVRLMDKNGRQQTHIANFRNSEVPLGEQPAQTIGISSYFKLGFMHILTGADHLLFVLCLILFMPKLAELIKTITAFTLAHSITLVLSALEILHIPQSPVEATIALSILFLARELVLKDNFSRFSVHRLWTVAFAFGLLHGFGFANALAEVGLPQGEVPQALVLFNLGVEAGQLAFILCTLPVIKLIRSATLWWPQSARLIHAVPVYLVGGVAGSWWLQRMMPILGVN